MGRLKHRNINTKISLIIQECQQAMYNSDVRIERYDGQTDFSILEDILYYEIKYEIKQQLVDPWQQISNWSL